MPGTMVYIKFMVSQRCKMVVESELERLGLRHGVIDLGMVEILDETSEEQRREFKENLLKSGLQVMEDKRSILIEKIKNVITEMIHYSEEVPQTNYSDLIAEK